jgi:hypothetical protein
VGVILLWVCVFPRESQNPILVAQLYDRLKGTFEEPTDSVMPKSEVVYFDSFPHKYLNILMI